MSLKENKNFFVLDFWPMHVVFNVNSLLDIYDELWFRSNIIMSTVLQPFIFVLQSDRENVVWFPGLNFIGNQYNA